MLPDDAASHQWDTIQAQITQGMLEHEVVMQALRVQSIVSALCILFVGGLCLLLWRRCAALEVAFHAEIRRHSNERIGQVKQHSLELQSVLVQMTHAFEGLASSVLAPLANISAPASPQPQPQPPSAPPPLPPIPPNLTGTRRR